MSSDSFRALPQASRTTITRIAWIVATILIVFTLIRVTGQGGRAGIGFFYAVPVGLGTWWLGWRAGLGVVCACVAMLFFGQVVTGATPNLSLALLMRIFALLVVWGLTAAARQQALDLRLSRGELAAVRAALTPPALPDAAGIEAAAAFIPSEHGVSGDFYFLTNSSDNKTIVVVGDVSGHGLESAQLATFVRASLASYAAHTADPAEILMLANTALAENADFDSGFVTAVCLAFDPVDASIEWAVAGHPVPLRLPDLEELGRPAPGLPLGVDATLGLKSNRAALHRDEGVLIYTDGATEARRSGRLLGAPGLRKLLRPVADLPVAELVAEAQTKVLEYSSTELRDDLCILALRPREPA